MHKNKAAGKMDNPVDLPPRSHFDSQRVNSRQRLLELQECKSRCNWDDCRMNPPLSLIFLPRIQWPRLYISVSWSNLLRWRFPYHEDNLPDLDTIDCTGLA